MVINTNIPSAYAARVLSNSTNNLAKSLAKLSSGSRITSPEDDAAGLAQSMKFSAELGRIDAARSNVGNMVSFSQTQDGFLSKIDSALRRMSELATLATDQTKANSDVEQYKKEFDELRSFIESTAGKTFNGEGLFATTLADAMGGLATANVKTLSTAVNTALTTYNATITEANGQAVQTALLNLSTAVRRFDANDNALAVLGTADAAGWAAAVTYWQTDHLGGASYDVSDLDSTSGASNLRALSEAVVSRVAQLFGGKTVTDASDGTSYQVKGVDISVLETDVKSTGTMASLTKSTAASYVTKITTHLNTLAGNRAFVGANISRLNMVESQLAVYGENLAAANSRIADVDVAEESANYAKQQILVQSGTAMLAQANLLSQSALRLLQ
jgi:flagellin